jgi:hypothetical protein
MQLYKIRSIVFPLILFLSLNGFSQTAKRFFEKKDLMLFGTYYYPEQWQEEQWERDIKNMADIGFYFTHYAGFTWSSLEPEEGKYDFSWLDDLKNWHIKSILLHDENIYKHGFQYLDWLIEGNNIIAVSRTAWEDETGQADNQHNANYLTFHRFSDFRNLNNK